MMTNYNEKYLPAFVELNREWITTHFVLEPMDLVQLENPQESILNLGGEIFFVLEEGAAVGTCAMVPHGPDCYELAKMAVSPKKRTNARLDQEIDFGLSRALPPRDGADRCREAQRSTGTLVLQIARGSRIFANAWLLIFLFALPPT